LWSEWPGRAGPVMPGYRGRDCPVPGTARWPGPGGVLVLVPGCRVVPGRPGGAARGGASPVDTAYPVD
jgi:hypothetical protein